MAISYVDTLRNAMLDEITTAADVASNAIVRIYDGSVPADADTALSGNTVLAELTMSATSAAAASGGVWTANSITDDTSADATGTATFFRLLTSAAATVLQGTVGTSGADLNLNSTSITAGDNVSITSWTITEGNN